jgi:hypothetical protein
MQTVDDAGFVLGFRMVAVDGVYGVMFRDARGRLVKYRLARKVDDPDFDDAPMPYVDPRPDYVVYFQGDDSSEVFERFEHAAGVQNAEKFIRSYNRPIAG